MKASIVAGLFALVVMSSAATAQTWFEQRMLLAHQYRDVRSALVLDQSTEAKLVDLLAKQELQRKQHELASSDHPSDPNGHLQAMIARAERETAYMSEVRELLGPEKFERFVDFKVSLMERVFVNNVEQELGAAHKLDPAQRERLVALYRVHKAHEDDIATAIFTSHPPSGPIPQGQALRYMIAGKERMFRNHPQSTQRLREAAAEFLSPQQLTVLEKVHARDIDSIRMSIEDDRARAGLVRTIPTQPDVQAGRTPVDGKIKLQVEFIANLKPKHFTHVAANNTAVTFEVAENLLLEVEPVLFQDNGFDVRLWCYETSPTGKRLIAQLRDAGVNTEGWRPTVDQGGLSEMIAGRKGYVITYNVLVDPQ